MARVERTSLCVTPSDTNDRARLAAIHYLPADVTSRAQRIYETVLAQSKDIRQADFTAISVADLRLLFSLYDAEFFGGLLAGMLLSQGLGSVDFRLANRMTRAGGTTQMLRTRTLTAQGMTYRVRYEIAVSTFLLFQTFRDPDRSVKVGGLPCRDRLQALQRVFEHELIHLVEFLAWGNSSCSAENFRGLAQRIFAHEDVRHDLVTPREVAATTFRILLGDLVTFQFEGRERKGRVNRITKRATVLVEDPAGRLYTDGKHYATFYVPLSWLTKAAPPSSGAAPGTQSVTPPRPS